MSKDYYKILGIDRDASQEQIKKAFKKAAIKWHPDKWSKKSEAEKKKAEENFKNCAEAYQVLSDPDKKAKYDQFGTSEGFSADNVWTQNFDDLFKSFGFGKWEDPFFGNFASSFNQRRSTEPVFETIALTMNVSIYEAFNGISRNITFNRYVKCGKCNGKGGSGEKECPDCHGTGMITKTTRTPFGISHVSHPCGRCNGTGKIYDSKCQECGGSGKKVKKETVKINKPGPLHFKYSDNGYYSIEKVMLFNNSNNEGSKVIVSFRLNDSNFGIYGKNVYEKISLPYYDCILGSVIKHTLGSGKTVSVNIPPGVKEGDELSLNGYGIDDGKYILIINVDLPKNITQKEEKLLKDIKKLHS